MLFPTFRIVENVAINHKIIAIIQSIDNIEANHYSNLSTSSADAKRLNRHALTNISTEICSFLRPAYPREIMIVLFKIRRPKTSWTSKAQLDRVLEILTVYSSLLPRREHFYPSVTTSETDVQPSTTSINDNPPRLVNVYTCLAKKRVSLRLKTGFLSRGWHRGHFRFPSAATKRVLILLGWTRDSRDTRDVSRELRSDTTARFPGRARTDRPRRG